MADSADERDTLEAAMARLANDTEARAKAAVKEGSSSHGGAAKQEPDRDMSEEAMLEHAQDMIDEAEMDLPLGEVEEPIDGMFDAPAAAEEETRAEGRVRLLSFFFHS